MEYRTEDGKTLWEDAGLKENDYDTYNFGFMDNNFLPGNWIGIYKL